MRRRRSGRTCGVCAQPEPTRREDGVGVLGPAAAAVVAPEGEKQVATFHVEVVAQDHATEAQVGLHMEQTCRIAVTDRGEGFHVAREMAAREGYGLGIVDGLADAWGVEAGPPHRVWCDLAV